MEEEEGTAARESERREVWKGKAAEEAKEKHFKTT